MNAGANVILTTQGIDDLCLKYFVEAGAMAVRRCKKTDLKRIAKATGGLFSFWFCIQSNFIVIVFYKHGVSLMSASVATFNSKTVFTNH